MATTILPIGPLRDGLVAQWQTIETLAGALTDEQWVAPSVLPGWTQADIVAHIIGTERMLAGHDVPAIRDVAELAHVRNPIGELNEKWLDHYRDTPRAEVLGALRTVVAERSEALTAMNQGDFDAQTMTPAGADTYGRFMRIRVFDCWMHEIDLRDGTDRSTPTDPAAAGWALDEIAASLPFVVGKRAGAPRGSTVIVDVTGLAARTVRIAVAERAAVVEEFADGDGAADVRLSLDSVDLARLVGGRTTADPASVTVDGDAELGAAIVGRLNYVI